MSWHKCKDVQSACLTKVTSRLCVTSIRTSVCFAFCVMSICLSVYLRFVWCQSVCRCIYVLCDVNLSVGVIADRRGLVAGRVPRKVGAVSSQLRGDSALRPSTTDKHLQLLSTLTLWLFIWYFSPTVTFSLALMLSFPTAHVWDANFSWNL